MKIRLYDRKSLRRCGILGGVLGVCASIGGCICFNMPGRSYSGPLPAPDRRLLFLAAELRRDVETLSVGIGRRNFQHYEGMERSVEFICGEFRKAGYEPRMQEYMAEHGALSEFRGAPSEDNNIYKNVVAEKKGAEKPDEIIVVGAHYDSVPFVECPAANDNASGVAAVLALSRRFANIKPRRTIRFVAFANEEPPYFWTKSMGSYVYAKSCREKDENIVGMMTPETIGYYSDEEGSQEYPPPLSWIYPSKGNFIAFVGNTGSASFVKDCVGAFRESAKFPSEGAALPAFLPGVGWSDHWSFWKHGYPALMITDTAPFRYQHYHTAQDTLDKISFEKMAMVVDGIRLMLAKIADE